MAIRIQKRAKAAIGGRSSMAGRVKAVFAGTLLLCVCFVATLLWQQQQENTVTTRIRLDLEATYFHLPSTIDASEKQQQQQQPLETDSNEIIRHSVTTPFMIGQSNRKVLARARLELFKTFCYPTMYHQTNQNFYWLVIMDSGLDQNIIDEVTALLNDIPSKRAYLVLSSSGTEWASSGGGEVVQHKGILENGVGLETVAKAFQAKKIQILTGDTQLLLDTLEWRKRQRPLVVLETLLDADDGLHRKAIESLQSVALDNLSRQANGHMMRGSGNKTTALLTLADTWWVFCAKGFLEWHNRDVVRTTLKAFEAHGLRSGLLLRRETPKNCNSAGYTRIGYSNDYATSGVTAFPKDANHMHNLGSMALPACNQPETQMLKHCRMQYDFPIALTSRTIASDSLRYMDPWGKAYTETSSGTVDGKIQVMDSLWDTLSDDFFIDRRMTQAVSIALFKERNAILTENQQGQSPKSVRWKRLKDIVGGTPPFRAEQPATLAIHDTEDPANQKRHQCIEAIRTRQFSLVGTLIRSCIDNLDSSRVDKALLMYPAYHENIGDHMITLAEITFLMRMGLASPSELLQIGEAGTNYVPNSVEQDFWLDDHFQANSRPALFHGGGNWGDLWRMHQDDRIAAIQNMMKKNFTIVGMPQSLFYESNTKKALDSKKIESIISASKTLNDHPVTFLWREQYSFDQASQSYPSANNVLFPDIAFQLGPFGTRFSPQNGVNAVDIVVFMRIDKESAVMANRNDASIKSLLSSIVGAEKAQNISFRIVDWQDQWNLLKGDHLFSDISIQLLSMGRILICDRLHASILAYISGIPFIFIDQMTGKVSKTLGVALNSGLDGCADGDTSAWARAFNMTEALRKAVNYLETNSFGGPKQVLLQNGTMALAAAET